VESERQYKLGLRYYNGNETEQDYIKAVHWFTKAAEQGHEDSKALLIKLREE